MNYDMMHACRLCPRECGADRAGGQRGFCGAGDRIMVARAALHFWEEPCISGQRGSGAVFFTGCSLGCVYCQNYEISGTGAKLFGLEVSEAELAGIFLRLQGEGAENINLVTACHFVPQVAEALRRAKAAGLVIPVIYNSGGYEKAETLRLLEGLVDVYLPDFKYMDADLAARLSRAPDYPDRAKEAIAEMVRQTGDAVFGPGYGAGPMIRRGVIVRHLLLPGHVRNAKAVVQYLHDTYGDRIWLSLMSQYTPVAPERAAQADPGLRRRVTKREYERLVDFALQTGVKNGFIQEGKSARESFIPSFRGEGVRAAQTDRGAREV